MAKIEDLIKNIADAKLRDEVAREVAKLKATKKFGLVFEEHIPEQVLLPGLPVKPGVHVTRRGGKSDETYTVLAALNGSRKFRLRREGNSTGGDEEEAAAKDLVVVKRFGEPIYPTLTPVEIVTHAPGKPYHTLINADNFHALQLLLYCYEGYVDVIYIDPPYNTGARDWKYNNNYVDATDQYRHSKWLAMMKRRLELARRLLKRQGVLVCAIDENELATLLLLLQEMFPAHEIVSVAVVHNPRGIQGDNFSVTNDFAVYVTPKGLKIIADRVISDDDQQGSNLRNWGGESLRTDAKNCFYPIYVQDGRVIGFGDVPPEKFHPGKAAIAKKHGRFEIWPIDNKGVERKWRYASQSVEEIQDLLEVVRGRKKLEIYLKKTQENISRCGLTPATMQVHTELNW